MTLSGFARSYIVRIYRIGDHKSRQIVGTVEEPGIQRKDAFTTMEDLWRILMDSQPDDETRNGSQK